MNSVLNPEAPEFHPHLNSTVQDGYLHVNQTIRISNTFPSGTSCNLFKTFTDFNIVTCKIRENVVLQSNQIMVKELPSVMLKCHGDDEKNMEIIIDVNDSLLDRININIDTLSGVNEPSEVFLRSVKTASWNRSPVIATIQVNGGSAILIGSRNIPRPQLMFKDPVDNSDKIFVPRISDKPNNIKPLALNILYNDEGQPVGYEHPYKIELELYEPPSEFVEDDHEPRFPAELEATPFTLVESEYQLDQLVQHLGQVREIAVDLEHHSYRTYQGITCLIQISTDEGGDFIVDALALREHIHKLNHSFTDPKKIKVFHGADSDIQWLQRDFGVYVVGMFDTHQAARLLRLAGLSLKYLLRRYCNVDTDKTFQLADWRMRPLPEKLLRYARIDTHYLLYIWRMMRRELLISDASPPRLVMTVFANSRQICGMTYNKVVVREDSHMPLYLRSKKRFNQAQMTALQLLYRWRDQQARELDESATYLLPNHMLLALADALPRELQGLQAVCSPMPPFVKHNLVTVHRMILSCRELPEQTQLYSMPAGVRGMLGAHLAPAARAAVHDDAALPDPREPRINLDLAWELLDSCQEGSADLQAFDDAARPAQLRLPPALAYLMRPDKNSKADELMFFPPYDRYRLYRAIYQMKDLNDIKEKEAKVAAIGQGNKLIREEVLEKLERAHDKIIKEQGVKPDNEPNKEENIEKFETTNYKKKASERKRKIIEKSEQKDAVEQNINSKKNIHKDDSNVKPFFYENVNYKKFYSDNDKRHKQPKMKFKKT